MAKGYLVLETGEVFEGVLLGELSGHVGEVVFNTSMTGYQEIITDPSYAGQILTFCYPLIGNYGLNAYDDESLQTAVSGVVTGEVCEEPSHFQASNGFVERLEKAGVPVLTGVDTRALVQVIRKHHTVKGVITEDPSSVEANDWKGATPFFVSQVSTEEPVVYEGSGSGTVAAGGAGGSTATFGFHSIHENMGRGLHIALMDFGYKKSILDALLEAGCKVTVVPYHYSFEQVKELEPDGILFSNGPGDPMALQPWLKEMKKMTEAWPTLGICLGHQLIALAHGARTKKLAFGHRGGNHPVKDLLTGKVWMTSQNHGYVVVDESLDSENFQILFRNVNDGTVEGLKHKSLPIQSVQFHPEAHPGPSDTEFVFQQFIQQVSSSVGHVASGGKEYAEA
ncbi:MULTISPECIES: carbamoyl phosphate synthase small subunit [Bacillaceae]|uniref:Carbamoyl phosphate synthase small chain n=1 Tax=Evansella alkalicola TaxID=745819 RepID=A0ABS6K0Z1_9BACI|nr:MULTISPECIES: carbamoyl phosphate synthase small subunit [Bacillaceae]MBU9723030.1 carbamoyl phosphate synthase small subunit [Bacillus alkalicola]